MLNFRLIISVRKFHIAIPSFRNFKLCRKLSELCAIQWKLQPHPLHLFTSNPSAENAPEHTGDVMLKFPFLWSEILAENVSLAATSMDEEIVIQKKH